MTTRKAYDRLNRLQSIESSPVNDQPLRYAYEYNQANQRTQIEMADGTGWDYRYDALGQLTQARKTGAKKEDGASRFDYEYDDVGNRKSSTTDGQKQLYQADALNRYQSVLSGQKTESFQYDADGNLVRDGQWTYSWDAENRLVGMESISTISPTERKQLEFAYDSQSRRIRKTVWMGSIDSRILTFDSTFLYDGWNLIAELSGTAKDKPTVRTYVWGLDLSGSLQGAGGVGGLSWMTIPGQGTFLPTYDGNGNVVGLVDAATGTIADRYEYDPFGNEILGNSARHVVSPFRFSAKYTDTFSGLVYYGYRYYSSSVGKWISRDKISEAGGPSLYGFLSNDSVDTYDILGLFGPIDHPNLADASFNAVMIQMYMPPPTSCQDRMRDRLRRANAGQDDGTAFNDLRRHFNRPYVASENEGQRAQNRQTWRSDYDSYLALEQSRFNNNINSPISSLGRCRDALDYLGRLSHSWQDFFGHAVEGSGSFGNGNTSFAATPDAPGDYWPSSYGSLSAEHGYMGEPIGSSGYHARYNAALEYVRMKFASMLRDWLAKCQNQCSCL